MPITLDPFVEPFGSIFSESISTAEYENGSYTYKGVGKFADFTIHPGSHTIHYSSNCFEGLKAHRQADGSVKIFRITDHVKRMLNSISSLYVDPPDSDLVTEMIIETAQANAADTPEQPGSLYIRPAFFGTLPIIGAAAAPTQKGTLFVITSPVGDYFKGGIRPLSLFVEEKTARTTPGFGMVKGGANYAIALGPTLEAKKKYGVDQVLFADNDDVTETGAANFFLVNDDTLITRNLDSSFLHGVTRDSLITLAGDLGYKVEERHISVSEIRSWRGEAFLSGTAAVVAPVGKLVFEDGETTLGDGQPGPNTLRLRETLTNIQSGKHPDTHEWLTAI